MLLGKLEQEREVWSLRVQKQELLFITMVKTVEDKLVGDGGRATGISSSFGCVKSGKAMRPRYEGAK